MNAYWPALGSIEKLNDLEKTVHLSLGSPARPAACGLIALVLLLLSYSAGDGPRRCPGGPNGIVFDAQDRLYVASVEANQIVVVDRENGQILKRIGLRQGVRTPDDLAIGPDGSLYWTSVHTGEVGRLTPRGERRLQYVGLGVNPITFSDNGRLFVALAYRGDALYELDPGLVAPPRLVVRDLGWLNGMDWGPDGRLYAPVWSTGEVVRINVDSGKIERISSGFGKPAAVKFDPLNRLHLVDYLTGSVFMIDVETGQNKRLAQLSPRLDNLAFDSTGRLFVSNVEERAVYEILPGGATRTLGGPTNRIRGLTEGR